MTGSGLGLSRATIGRSWWQRFSARFDWPLFGVILCVVGIGLMNLYSALTGTSHEVLFSRQVIWMSIGVFAYLVVTLIDYRVWLRFAWIGLAIAVFLVGLVDIIGVSVKGSQRWIPVLGVAVQPSELAKIAVIIAVARLVQDAENAEMRALEQVARVLALAVPVVLVLLQPDLGSASLIGLIILSVGFLTVHRLWLLVTGVSVGLIALPLFWDQMHQYQRDRVLAFLDPSADPTGVGWHTRQSVLAVGAGRLTGEGYMNGAQNQFKFLPEHWTDFPFSVFAEA